MSEGGVVVGGIAIFVGLVLLIGWLNGREKEEFYAKCALAGENTAKCDLLWEVKSAADDAAMAAGFAAGFAATSRR